MQITNSNQLKDENHQPLDPLPKQHLSVILKIPLKKEKKNQCREARKINAMDATHAKHRTLKVLL